MDLGVEKKVPGNSYNEDGIGISSESKEEGQLQRQVVSNFSEGFPGGLDNGVIKAKSFYGSSSVASGNVDYSRIRKDVLSKKAISSSTKERNINGGGKSKKGASHGRITRKEQRNPYVRKIHKSRKEPIRNRGTELKVNAQTDVSIDMNDSHEKIQHPVCIDVQKTISPMFSSDTESQDAVGAKISSLINKVCRTYDSNSDDILSLDNGESETRSESLEIGEYNSSFSLSFSSDHDSCDINQNAIDCKDRNGISSEDLNIASDDEGVSLCSFIDKLKSVKDGKTENCTNTSSKKCILSRGLNQSLSDKTKSLQDEEEGRSCFSSSELENYDKSKKQDKHCIKNVKTDTPSNHTNGTGLFRYFKRTSPKDENNRTKSDDSGSKVVSSAFQKGKEQLLVPERHSPNNKKTFNQKLIFDIAKSSPETDDDLQVPKKQQKKEKRQTLSPRMGPKKMEQLYIDVGQKNFGHTTCEACGMVYTKTLPEDALEHSKYHQKLMQKLKFKGWKSERVLQEFHDGRIIQVNAQDNSLHLKKISDVRDIVDGELGFARGVIELSSLEKVFIFVSMQKIVGCAIAVPVSKAYPVIANQGTPSPEVNSGVPTLSWCCSGLRMVY
ncbi:uncharacterized protein LOC135688768 isoform X2 [Rhopilema esculentum]|uniref:uncharacterized protein LOC135688768 isoform X2 n=1 Tax=Rhopilema esculentum TaxID=499914 RepID=UPI0031E22F0D